MFGWDRERGRGNGSGTWGGWGSVEEWSLGQEEEMREK